MSNSKRKESGGRGQGAGVKEFLLPITHCPSPITRFSKGFTLIEVLVALAVVSSVFLLVLTSFSFHIDIFDRKKDSLRLVLQAKENLYLYKIGKLTALAGTKEGMSYEIKVEDMEYHLKKVSSTVRSDRNETSLLEYIRK